MSKFRLLIEAKWRQMVSEKLVIINQYQAWNYADLGNKLQWL